MRISRMTFEQRFWSKVEKAADDECWIWRGTKMSNGYGMIGRKMDGTWKFLGAHRVSYQMSNGPIPAGMVVCHHCDTKDCVNPSHLFAGSQLENMADMRRKGRSGRGQRQWKSKLTEADVLRIRDILKVGSSHDKIGAYFGVSRTVITKVKSGALWGHV